MTLAHRPRDIPDIPHDEPDDGTRAFYALPSQAEVAKGYTWFSTTNHDRALTWATSLQSTSDTETHNYLVNAIVDLVHYDRASRAVSVLSDDTKPLREADLENTIYKGGPHWMRGTGRYYLTRKPFVWGPDAPPTAVDALARVTTVSPPDECWIGEYVQEEQTPIEWDPIIYAQYGEWLVEVARWD